MSYNEISNVHIPTQWIQANAGHILPLVLMHLKMSSQSTVWVTTGIASALLI